ncbi:MAG: BrnT family toxin [Thermoleophilia bacterium]
MRFQFDPSKGKSNKKKHGISFVDAEGIFYDPLAVHQLATDRADEERFVAVGMGSTGQVMVAVYTRRGEEIRLVSARPATRREVKQYES